MKRTVVYIRMTLSRSSFLERGLRLRHLLLCAFERRFRPPHFGLVLLPCDFGFRLCLHFGGGWLRYGWGRLGDDLDPCQRFESRRLERFGQASGLLRGVGPQRDRFER